MPGRREGCIQSDYVWCLRAGLPAMTILFSFVCGSVCAVLCVIIGGFEGHVHPDLLGPEIDDEDEDAG